MLKAAKPILAILTVCLLACILVGCNKTENSNSPNIHIDEISDEYPDDYYEEKIDDVNNISEVKTEYGSLYYPQRFEANMKTEITNDNDGCMVEFFSECDGRKYSLFYINIGIDGGQLAGYITDDKGTERNVFVIVPEIENIDVLSSENQDKLYAMQEAVNIVVDNLK